MIKEGARLFFVGFMIAMAWMVVYDAADVVPKSIPMGRIER